MTHKLKLLTHNKLGMVHRCECCSQFHITTGCISVRLNSKELAGLVDLISMALKREALIRLQHQNNWQIN
jgi:hypothetical protein